MTSKYYNKKTAIDGKVFDSRKEGEYYRILKQRRKLGQIKSFTCQPEFVLQGGFGPKGARIRAIKYFADFEVRHNDGSIEIVDVKGIETDVFKIKWKILKYIYRDTKNVKFLIWPVKKRKKRRKKA